jgi:hypothetical protein
MSRQRIIKPEFWASERVADCTPNARLLFIGLLNFCDDNGIHPHSAKTLKMEIFPGDSFTLQDIENMIEELLKGNPEERLLYDYVIDNKRYLLVTGWHRHQKIEKKYYRYPTPNNILSFYDYSENIPILFPDHSATIRRPVLDRSTPELSRREEKSKHKPATLPEEEEPPGRAREGNGGEKAQLSFAGFAFNDEEIKLLAKNAGTTNLKLIKKLLAQVEGEIQAKLRGAPYSKNRMGVFKYASKIITELCAEHDDKFLDNKGYPPMGFGG